MGLIGGKRSLDEDVRKVADFRKLQAARSVPHGPNYPGAERERAEMLEILIRYGYEHSAADVVGLQRDGMGPEELGMRARRHDDNIGYWAANARFKTLRRS